MGETCKTCDGTGKIEHDITEDEYEEMLNDAYGDVDICGYKYSAGHALKEIDPIAFNVGMSDQPTRKEKCEDCDGEGEIEIEEEVA